MRLHGTKIFFLICAVCALMLGVFAVKGASRALQATQDKAAAVAAAPPVAGATDNAAGNTANTAGSVAATAPHDEARKPLSAAPAFIPDPAVQAGLMPHKALYSIKMSSKKSGSQIVNISGQMLYEWEGGCQGWTSDHKFNLRYEYADTPPMLVTSDFSTYEPFDGGSFSFVSQRKRDGEVFEELRGQATLEAEKGGAASYRIPENMNFDLPAGALFPMRHTLAVLQHIKAGDKFFRAVVFDGSDQDGPVEINAFIGKPAQAKPVAAAPIETAPTETADDKAQENGKDDDAAAASGAAMKENALDQTLLSGKAYNVRLAFFPLLQQEAVSDYEMSMIFHENGIISDMEVDYHDFSVTQKLVALEKKPLSVGCGAQAGERPFKPE